MFLSCKTLGKSKYAVIVARYKYFGKLFPFCRAEALGDTSWSSFDEALWLILPLDIFLFDEAAHAA